MNRLTALRVVLGITGVLFLLASWPMVAFIRQEPAISMMMSLYVTLGVFLLLAIGQPQRHRSLIAFAAWSSVVHACWMAFQAYRGMVAKTEAIGSAVLMVIGVLLIVLAPKKTS